MKSFEHDQRGISLIELLLTITIVSILSIVMMGFMTSWFSQNAITQTRAQLLTNSQDALDIITDTIRLSSAADLNNRFQDPYAPSAPTNLLSWQSNATTLVLATAVEDTSGNIIFSDPSNYTSYKNNLIFFVKNGILYRRTLGAPVTGNRAKTTCPATNKSVSCPSDRILAQNVQSLSVRYLNAESVAVTPTNARSVELTLTISKKSFGQTLTASDKARMVFRND